MLPQKISLPFSLVNSPYESVPGISPSLNEIFPGWLLSDSIFTILRNEAKFQARQTGSVAACEWRVLRADIFKEVLRARNELTNIRPEMSKFKTLSGEAVYTEKEFASLGKNYLKESVRLRAVQTYSDFLQWFALKTLWETIKANGPRALLSGAIESEDWAFCKTLLPSRISLSESLGQFLELHDRLIVQGCLKGKERDKKRAEAVIGSSYSEMHPRVSVVEVCVTAVESAKRLRSEIESVLLSAKF
jgi:hypothetical protein